MVIFVGFNSDDTTGRNLGFPDTAIILNIGLIISMSMLYHVPSMLGSENKAAKKSSYTSAFYGKTEEQERRGRWTLSIYFETSNTRICMVCVTAVGIIA